MISYESVLAKAGIGECPTDIDTYIPFIIRHLATFFKKTCRILVQITYPGYSRAQITGLFAFSCAQYQPFDESDYKQWPR